MSANWLMRQRLVSALAGDLGGLDFEKRSAGANQTGECQSTRETEGEREREREARARGDRKTTGYEPFDLDGV